MFCALAAAFFSFTADDSYIAFRYARNLAAGVGAAFDAQTPREAYSSPSWIALSAIPFRLGATDRGAVVAMKIAGISLGAMTVLLTGALAKRQTPDGTGARVASLLLAAMPWMAFWSAGGLETPLYTALLTGALASESAILFTLLALTRPEGLLVALAAILAGPSRHRVRSTVLVGVVWLALEMWRYSYYGSLLPATFAAKAGLSRHDLHARVVELAPFAVYALPLLVVIWLARRRLHVQPSLLAATFAQAAFAAVPRLESTPWFRYEIPLLPLLAAMAGAGIALVDMPAARRRMIAAALVASALTPLWWLRQPSQYSPSTAEIMLGEWLRTYQPDARLALYDIGAVPYFSRAPFVFDSNPDGPLKPTIGRSYDLDALVDWSPTWAILPGPGAPPADPLAHLASHPRFAANYTRMFVVETGDGYVFTVWRRNDVRLSDDALVSAEGLGLYQRRGSRSTGGNPKYSYARAVATRPRGVRSMNPA